MKVITTIVITQEISKGEEEQVKRNYDRSPMFGGTDVGIRKHIQRLIPVLTDEEIDIKFRIEEPAAEVFHVVGESGEILGTFIGGVEN